MWFGILGPLLVRDGDAAVSVPAPRQRVLLAALLMHAGKTVRADELAEIVWDGTPPAGAATTLRSHVMRLRGVLGPGPGARVVTRYPGYVIHAAEHEVDLLRFTFLCGEGGAAVRAGVWARAWESLGEALGLWRGEPLGDIPCELLRREQALGLEQLRLQAVEWRIEAGLHLGCHGALLPELQSLVARHPLRECFHAQLMLALYRCGRQAEAFAAYQQARQILVNELGIEPGAQLRELHRQILAADPALAAPRAERPSVGVAGPSVPRQLPPAVVPFTGRADELAALTGLLDKPDGVIPGAAVISAIGGTAGVGKTALAVHWAHRVAGRFPEGQLYVNLRGYDPGLPMPAADALAGFLRALGVPGQDIPAEETERTARYRSMLSGRRMLVVLDNASEAEQVRPLLPGTPSCVLVVTSRDQLAGLVARDGAQRLDLDPLPLEDAIGLLRALIGPAVDADPDAAASLADRCARLPLALRVAAELAAARPAAPLADLAGELAGQQRRLDLLDAGGDPRTAVRAVFSWSAQHLDADTACAFRLLGLHPGPDLDRYAAAALTGSTAQQTCRMLRELARAHLIQSAQPGRHGMHDLLRAYARELAATQDTAEEQSAALTRLLDYYLRTAAAAMDTLFPAERHRRPRVPPPATPVPPVSEAAAARAWLDAERVNLVAVSAHAADCGWPRLGTRLAATLFRYLEAAGHYPEIIAINACACRAARHIGDRPAEAAALTALGLVDWEQGRSQQATGCFQQALALYRQTRDQAGQARTLNNLGLISTMQGRYPEAADQVRASLALHHEAGDQTGEARALSHLGDIERLQRHYQQATTYLQQSLALLRQVGDRNGAAHALIRLGIVSMRQGRYQQARSHLQESLALFREIGGRGGQAAALTSLGDISLRQRHHQQAASCQQQSLALFREIGDQSGEAEALNGLGEALLAAGQASDARTRHTEALGIASQIGDKDQQARAHNGLGHTHHTAGDPDQASRHRQQALILYTSLGAPEADQIRALLATAQSQEDRVPKPRL